MCQYQHHYQKSYMKQLNLSETQLSELREIYRAKLSNAVAAVEEIRGVLRQLDTTSASAPASESDSVSSAPVRRGRKAGKKAGKRTRRTKAEMLAAKGAPSAVTSSSNESSTDAAPKKRGRKPGFKPSTITKAGRPAKKRGRKPKNA